MEDIDSFFEDFKENRHIKPKTQTKTNTQKQKTQTKMVDSVYPPKKGYEGYYISKTGSNNLHKMLNPLRNNEVEISIGSFTRGAFNPSVNPREFTNLKNVLFKTQGVSVSEHHTLAYNKGEYRCIVNKENDLVKYETKVKNDYFDDTEWGWRARGSIETEIPSDEVILSDLQVGFIANSLLRDKRRISFEFSDHGVQIDLTIVEQNGKTKYEIEMEIHNFDIEHSVVDWFLHVILSGMKDVLSINNRVLTISEKRNVIRKYNSFFGNQKLPFLKAPVNKPLPLIPFNVLSGEPYSITPKFDGMRKFLFFSSDGVYSISINNNSVEYVGDAVEKYNDTIIDCELMDNFFYPFDTLIYKSHNFLKNDFITRKTKFVDIDTPFIKHKPFFDLQNSPNSTFFENVKQCFEWMDSNDNLKYDGIVAQIINEEYKNTKTMKWKNIDKLSIDLRVKSKKSKINEINESSIINCDLWMEYDNKASHTNEEKIFEGTKQFELVNFGCDFINNSIVEFKLEKPGVLKAIKIRDDKVKPNFDKTVNDTWKLMHNPITKQDLLGETMFFYRKWANVSKKKVIQYYVPSSSIVLDIGIGRGGDISKWKHINKLYGIDVDQENLNEFYKRVESLPNRDSFQAKLIGGEDTEEIKKFVEGKKMDVISSFFSLTFFPSSSSFFNSFLQTLDEMSKVGTKFIGITMDGEKVRKTLGRKKKIKNDLYSITKVKFIPKQKLGNEIVVDIPDTMVSNQTEYLVDFKFLTSELKKIGFELVESHFIENSSLHPLTQEFASHQRMFVFQKSKSKSKIIETKKSEMKSVEFGKKKEIKVGEKTFIRSGMITGNNSYFHSLYYMIDKKYREMYKLKDEKGLTELVCGKREKLGKKLTPEIFKQLLNNNVEHNLAYDLLYSKPNINTPEKAKELAFSHFSNLIKDCEGWVGLEITEYIHLHLKINIVVYDLKTKKVLVHEKNDKFKNTIHILSISNLSFEPLKLKLKK